MAGLRRFFGMVALRKERLAGTLAPLSELTQLEPGGSSTSPLPHPSRCRVQYSQFLNAHLCLVPQPDECPYGAKFVSQTYCCHPQAETIATATQEKLMGNIPPDTAI